MASLESFSLDSLCHRYSSKSRPRATVGVGTPRHLLQAALHTYKGALSTLYSLRWSAASCIPAEDAGYNAAVCNAIGRRSWLRKRRLERWLLERKRPPSALRRSVRQRSDRPLRRERLPNGGPQWPSVRQPSALRPNVPHRSALPRSALRHGRRCRLHRPRRWAACRTSSRSSASI